MKKLANTAALAVAQAIGVALILTGLTLLGAGTTAAIW